MGSSLTVCSPSCRISTIPKNKNLKIHQGGWTCLGICMISSVHYKFSTSSWKKWPGGGMEGRHCDAGSKGGRVVQLYLCNNYFPLLKSWVVNSFFVEEYYYRNGKNVSHFLILCITLWFCESCRDFRSHWLKHMPAFADPYGFSLRMTMPVCKTCSCHRQPSSQHFEWKRYKFLCSQTTC